MTTYMYCLYVGVDYTYIDINALAQGIKSFLASQVWFQAVAGARTYGTDSPKLLVSHANHSATETSLCMYLPTYLPTYLSRYTLGMGRLIAIHGYRGFKTNAH